MCAPNNITVTPLHRLAIKRNDLIDYGLDWLGKINRIRCSAVGYRVSAGKISIKEISKHLLKS
jgi:hypothetical protein